MKNQNRRALAALLDNRDAKANGARALLENGIVERRTLTAAETATFDGLIEEIAALDARILAEVDHLSREGSRAVNFGTAAERAADGFDLARFRSQSGRGCATPRGRSSPPSSTRARGGDGRSRRFRWRSRW